MRFFQKKTVQQLPILLLVVAAADSSSRKVLSCLLPFPPPLLSLARGRGIPTSPSLVFGYRCMTHALQP